MSLTVTDEYGCENTFSKPEYVRIEPAVPQYSVLEGDTVCKGMQTHFLNETGYSCRWDFGDGGTSMQNTPIHIYQQTGNVNVTFTVDPGGQCEASTEFTLFVETITASFTTNPTNLYSCSIPFEVEFKYFISKCYKFLLCVSRWNFINSAKSFAHLFISRNISANFNSNK